MTADLTPVQQLQTEMGVEFYEWDGWPWPSNFGNPVEEYLAVRNGVGIVENSGLRKWELRGPDALRAADRIVTQDLSAMPVGRVHYTPVCNEEGMALDDITVFHLGPTASCSCPGCWPARRTSAPSRRARRRARAGERRAGRRSDPGPAVAGRPRSRHGRRSRRARRTSIARDAVVGGEECILSRTGYSGELGYEIFASPASGRERLDARCSRRRGASGSAPTGSRRPTTCASSRG